MVKEKNNDLYKDVRLIMIGVRYMWWTGNSFLESVLELDNTKSNNTVTSELLLTQSLELLLKSYFATEICIKNRDKDRKCVELMLNEFFRKFGHDMVKLLNNDAYLKNMLDISDVGKIENDFVSDFRISLNNSYVLSFKELESVRYGVFAKNQNLLNGPVSQNNLSFLKKLSEIVSEKIRLTFVELGARQ
ncbi:MAG TPA: hypothetical protein PJ997_03030 [Candidatus Paceibacterota bacterium]|nr:hypothetical protein [Candidatus Paceibacterota bacterium]HMP85128.1 hypothetical protein [Candidatus Paceibacterota bacterium]